MQDKFTMMINYFLEDASIYINEIKKGFAENDLKKIISNSHTLKSSSIQVGAVSLSQLSKTIEEMGRELAEKSDNNIAELNNFAKMEDEFKIIEDELKKLI
jgi:HPt (histidine-containing phosphotransfer) domain-containing protein